MISHSTGPTRKSVLLSTCTPVNDARGSPSLPTQDDAASEKARARKIHMLSLEACSSERDRQRTEKVSEAKAQSLRRGAQEKAERENDVVKLLNTYQQRAVAFHIRDLQLRDQAVQKKKEQEYERRMELAMEADRLREMERRESEELEKAERLVEARRVIEEQIEDRHQSRLLQAEAKDQENRGMLDQIRQYQTEDEERARVARKNAERARIEVIKLNEEAAEKKRQEKLREKEEDARILLYQDERDEALRKREEEERQAELRKKEIQNKLLENQSRTLDKRAELDELRARRAAEQKEREYRQKELDDARRKKSQLAILAEERRQYEEDKRETKRRDVKTRKEEYENILRQARDMAVREEREAEITEKKNANLRAVLQQQIEENENLRRGRQNDKFDEGRRRQEETRREIAKMEGIRDQMVQEMKGKGVGDKYLSEMMSLDINKFLMK